MRAVQYLIEAGADLRIKVSDFGDSILVTGFALLQEFLENSWIIWRENFRTLKERKNSKNLSFNIPLENS